MSAIAEAVREQLAPAQVRSIAQATERINVWEGAIRSGKTIASLIAWLIHVATMASSPGEVLVVGKTREAIARNVFGPLTDPRIFGPIAAHVRYTAGAPTATIFGQTVHVIGASDAKAEPKVRGLTAKSAYADEITVLPVDFFRQLLGRLSITGARLYGSTNPDNPNHWLRKDYLLRPNANRLRSWHFTLDDNTRGVDAEFVAWAKSSYVGLWYKRFVLGEWVQAEGAIFGDFDPARHVIAEVPALSQVIATGVDYGTRNPFAALMLGQGTDGRLVLTREYRHDPRTSREQLTDAAYSARYRAWLGADVPRFHAVDPSAASFKLQLHHDGVRGVVDADNGVTDGIRLVASLFATNRLHVHRSCLGLLAEVPGYAWDDKEAEKGEDKPIKAGDHSCFVAGTQVRTERGDVAIEAVVPGDRVATRDGFRPVRSAGMTSRSAQVYDVELDDGTTLTGTGNHPVWVAGAGWTRLDALRYADTLQTWCSLSTSSSTTGSSSGDTRTLSASPTGATSCPVSHTDSGAFDGCTRKSGSTTTAQSRPVGTFTIGITTTSTTIPATSKRPQPPSTGRITSRIGARPGSSPGQTNLPTWNASARPPLSGTGRTRGGPGTPSTVAVPGMTARRSSTSVSSAAAATTRGRSTGLSGSVRTAARARGAEQPDSTTSTGSAKGATRHSGSTATSGRGSAPVRVLSVTARSEPEPVWNLTVADTPEYFAGGVLVHNCDAMRYAIATTEPLWRRALPPAELVEPAAA